MKSCLSLLPLLAIATSRPRSVLYIVFDDFRPVLPFYGHPEIHAPHLDALANKSIVFDRAYCNQAVCSPSRNSFLTGRRPNTTQTWNFFNHFREARCPFETGVALADVGAVAFRNWTVADPQQSGGAGQCCTSCTGAGVRCAAWSYRGKTCTLFSSIGAGTSSRLACAANETCVSGNPGSFPRWTTLPQAFREAGYLTLGTGKLFHDGGAGFGSAAGPDAVDGDGDGVHVKGNGTPPQADPVSWTNCTAQYPDFGTVPGPRWQNAYAQNHAYLCVAGAGKCAGEGVLPRDNQYCLEDVPLSGEGADPPLVDYPTSVDAVNKLRHAVRNRDATGQPFFLGVGIKRPHLPFRVPRGYAALYPSNASDPDWSRGAFALPKHPTLDPSIDPIAWTPFFTTSPSVPLPDNATKALRLHYYMAISYADYVAGQVLQEVQRLGADNDTLIMVHADHGWHLGEKAMWEKRTVWEAGTRVPFLIHVPWMPRTHGTRTRALTELVDVMPTLLDLMGVAPPKSDTFPLDGRSFRSVLDPGDAPAESNAVTAATHDAKDYALSVYPRCPNATQNRGTPFKDACIHIVERTQFDVMGYSLRTDRFRYTEWVHWNGSSLAPRWDAVYARELYDHAGDDGTNFDDFEVVNELDIFEREQPGVVAALAAKLREVAQQD